MRDRPVLGRIYGELRVSGRTESGEGMESGEEAGLGQRGVGTGNKTGLPEGARSEGGVGSGDEQGRGQLERNGVQEGVGSTEEAGDRKAGRGPGKGTRRSGY